MNKFKLIDNILIIFVILTIFTCVSVSIIERNKKVEIITKCDTVKVTIPDYNLIEQNDSLLCLIDSLQILNVKYKEELELANFKLERIKYYNTIAAKNNNIKYLRGWINRVFNE